MGVLGRLFKVGEAEANKVVDRLERPEAMLEQAIRDQDKKIKQARQAVASVIATERASKQQLNELERQEKDWESKARIALGADKEELAGKALTRSEEFASQINDLKPVWEQQRREVDDLKQGIRSMEDEVASLKRQKDSIIAQYRAAQAKKNIYAVKANMDTKNTGQLIDRMKKKAQTASYEAEASKELAEDNTGDSLESEFSELKNANLGSNVQDKLAALKAQMNKE